MRKCGEGAKIALKYSLPPAMFSINKMTNLIMVREKGGSSKLVAAKSLLKKPIAATREF